MAQAQLAATPWPQNDEGARKSTPISFLAGTTDSSYDPTWLRLPSPHWIQELGSLIGESQSLGVGPACHSHSILTEEDWTGACEDTLLPEVLPCLLATRLAWKEQTLVIRVFHLSDSRTLIF